MNIGCGVFPPPLLVSFFLLLGRPMVTRFARQILLPKISIQRALPMAETLGGDFPVLSCFGSMSITFDISSHCLPSRF